MSSLLETTDLTISFGGLTAVDKVAFNVNQGEIVGLIGPNGSGKTTFFNLVTGIYRPTFGSIFFRGKNIVGFSSFEIARMGVTRTFQNLRLFANLSVLDNVMIGMHHKQRSQWYHAIFWHRFARRELNEAAEKAEELLSYFSKELVEDPYKKAAELPLAHRRRLEICRALASDPTLLLLDEPSAGMDPEETFALMDDIRKTQKRKKEIGIVLIEHDMTVIENIADRVFVLNYGKKIAHGSFVEISQNPEVLEAYLGKRNSDAQA